MAGDTVLSLVLDGIVMILLAAVIVFAARLSLHLRDFRADRQDLERVIADLSAGIVRAEAAMAGLRETARESGRDLQALINEAASLSEELQFMNETGNNMARRLAQTAERSARARTSRSPAVPEGFSIHDPEFGREEDTADDFMAKEDDDADDDSAAGLPSRAERELFEALQGVSGRKKVGA